MIGKEKVSRELGLALDELLEGRYLSDSTKSQLLHMRVHKQFVETSRAWGIRKNPLNKIGTIKFARILENGYEYEHTPEEELSAHYKECKYSHTTDDKVYANGMKKAVDILGLQITGINK